MDGAEARSVPRDRSQALNRLKFADKSFEFMTLAAAVFVLLLLLGVAISLFIGALPASTHFGLDFFISDAWSPPKERFGAAAAIYGTVVTAIIAMIAPASSPGRAMGSTMR